MKKITLIISSLMNMKKTILSTLLLLFCLFQHLNIHGQSHTFTPTDACINCSTNIDNSAVFEIQSTNKGILIPRMTDSQRDAITNPTEGLLVYVTNLDNFYFYNGSNWVLAKGPKGDRGPTGATGMKGDKGETGPTGPSHWSLNGTAITNTNTGDVIVANRLIVGNNFSENNIFIGINSGLNTTPSPASSTGTSNLFLGNLAGETNTTGSQNTFIGNFAGKNNLYGGSNTFIGQSAGFNNKSGQQNVFLGMAAAIQNDTGSYNVIIGDGASINNTSGAGNTFIGKSVATMNTTGLLNTCIGYQANVGSTNLINATALGSEAIVDASNKVTIGNSFVSVIGGYANWSNLSDQRYKQRIKKEAIEQHLDFILQLEPVSYNYNTVKLVKDNHQKLRTELTIIGKRQKNNSDLNTAELTKNHQQNLKLAAQKDKIRYTGFLAQSVEKAAENVGYNHFSGILKPAVNGGKYALRYAEFVVPLVGAVQAQQTETETLQTEIETLQIEVETLKKLVKTLIASKGNSHELSIPLDNPYLEQNIPNPFNTETEIPYFIPLNSQRASIHIYNLNGQLMQSIPIKTFGQGTIPLSTHNLNNGSYTYSLEVDGRLIQSKKMNLVK